MAKRQVSEVDDYPDWELILAGRLVPDAQPQPGEVIKLISPGTVALNSRHEIKADVGKMAVTVRISTPNADLAGDVVYGKGIDCRFHRMNPLVLLMHNRNNPIGRSLDEAGNYTVVTGDNETIATTYFFQKSLEAEQAFRLVEMGAIPGASIGFKPKAGMVKTKFGSDGKPYMLVSGCDLIEYSHVTIPENPETLVIAIQKGLGGKPLCEPLMQMFAPLMPAKTAWSNGATLSDTLGDINKELDRMGEKQLKVMKSLTALIEKDALQDCVSAKVPKLLDEGYERDQALAIAYSYCRENKALGTTDDTAGGSLVEDKRPAGAQFGAALYELAVSMGEFASQHMGSLEPEASEAYSKFHDFHAQMCDYLKEAYESRYPDEPKLGKEDEGEDKEKRKSASDISRGHIRDWWAARQVKIEKAEEGPAKEAAAYLDSISAYRGPWTPEKKIEAKKHSKALLGALPPVVTKSVDEAGEDWSAVLKSMEERDKVMDERLAKLS